MDTTAQTPTLRLDDFSSVAGVCWRATYRFNGELATGWASSRQAAQDQARAVLDRLVRLAALAKARAVS